MLSSAFLVGCEAQDRYNREQEQRRVPVADQTAQAESGSKRFRAAFHGEFFGGFDNNVRQIFVITDTSNGTQYLTITGCGVTELRTENTTQKTTITVEE